MTPQASLEIQGNLVAHSAAELVSEIVRAELTGSLRLEDKGQKAILYFNSGSLSFAVSNARKSRLFDMLISRGRFSKEELAAIPNFTNDLELAAQLQEKQLLTKAEIDDLTSGQIDSILIDVLSWIDGSWSFSPLARVRKGLDFQVDIVPVLLQYSRCLTSEIILKHVGLKEDRFSRSSVAVRDSMLAPEEERALETFTETPKNLQDFLADTSLDENSSVRSVYVCWLIGLLERSNWRGAFSPSAIRAMNDAHLQVIREAARVEVAKAAPEPAVEKSEEEAKPAVTEPAMSVNDYLARVEKAKTHYEVLGISSFADPSAIKKAYFSLAKQFHPDHFHKESGGIAMRVQTAFAELSKAYETLKTEDARELYDFRMKKEIGERERLGESGLNKSVDQRLQQARTSFEHGQDFLQKGDVEKAVPLFARAAHFDPKNAKYRAEYGLILARDETQKHKAEAELQAAVKLAPESPAYRMMLAQFFVDMNLRKRAEGELGRLLNAFPYNREALALLETLR